MSDSEPVLFANEAFYYAFAGGDAAAMDEVWARDVPVACIHPGWNVLTGRDAVMESWRSILGSDSRPAIRSQDARAVVYGDVAFVTCYENVGQGYLAATNVFVREGGAWKMVHHHAGPTAPPEAEELEDAPDLVH
ncbi:MAG: nuclear transport factor 2 family protein [Proteobacteria bacterium]|nr:nuclear transport factor 2 family protein [Pseudomonadota bacterium]